MRYITIHTIPLFHQQVSFLYLTLQKDNSFLPLPTASQPLVCHGTTHFPLHLSSPLKSRSACVLNTPPSSFSRVAASGLIRFSSAFFSLALVSYTFLDQAEKLVGSVGQRNGPEARESSTVIFLVARGRYHL